MQACKLAPVIGHFSGKFGVLTGECWVWPDLLTGLFRCDVKHNIFLLKKDKREGGLLI